MCGGCSRVGVHIFRIPEVTEFGHLENTAPHLPRLWFGMFVFSTYHLSFFSSEGRKNNEITDLETVLAFLLKRVVGTCVSPRHAVCLMEELEPSSAEVAPLSCAPSNTEQLNLFPVMVCNLSTNPTAGYTFTLGRCSWCL